MHLKYNRQSKKATLVNMDLSELKALKDIISGACLTEKRIFFPVLEEIKKEKLF